MKRILMIFVIACVACACGGAGGSTIAIKTGGKDVSLASKSSGTYKTVKTFTDINQNITKATAFDVYLANYEMDSTSPMTMRKALTSADQVRVSMQLIGAEGTDQNSEFKPGVYKADPTLKYMKLDSLGITTFADGKEVTTRFETMSSTAKISGQVEVKSVTADAISGTIDVTEGDKTIKGDFTAKIAAKK